MSIALAFSFIDPLDDDAYLHRLSFLLISNTASSFLFLVCALSPGAG
jgi:hypothetical protein